MLANFYGEFCFWGKQLTDQNEIIFDWNSIYLLFNNIVRKNIATIIMDISIGLK